MIWLKKFFSKIYQFICVKIHYAWKIGNHGKIEEENCFETPLTHGGTRFVWGLKGFEESEDEYLGLGQWTNLASSLALSPPGWGTNTSNLALPLRMEYVP
jgi:hypothetical protein